MENENCMCGKHEVLVTAPYDMHDRMWGVSISAAGRTSASLPYDEKSVGNRMPMEYCLVCIARGAGYLDSEAYNHKRVEAGNIIFLLPKDTYTLTPDNGGWEIYWAEFGGYSIDNMVRNSFFTAQNGIFQVEELHHITDVFKEIIKIMSNERPGRQQYVGSLIHLVLGKMYYSAQSDNLENSYMLRIINQAKSIMKDETQMHLPIDMVADQLGISYSLFRREFRRICGIPPGQFRQEVKLKMAKELLHTTNTSIADIANHLSFENLGQFSTFFRKRVGVPPLEFRKKGMYSQALQSENKGLK